MMGIAPPSKKRGRKGNGDGDDDYNSDDSSSSKSVSDSDEEDIPDDWMFPSFYVFILWGPFVEPDNRLNIAAVDDRGRKKGVGNRKQSRGKDVEEKRLGNNADTSSNRGLTMDHRIEIQNLTVRHQIMSDRQRESTIVAFSVEEGMISRQLEQAERRAESRCPDYDATNIFWIKVDRLMEKQEGCLKRIEEYNAAKTSPGFDVNKELFGDGGAKDGSESDDYILSPTKSPENNSPSPTKQGKITSLPAITPVDLNVSDSDNELEDKDEEQDDGNLGLEENEIVPPVKKKTKRKATVAASNVLPKKRVSNRSRPIRKSR